MRDILQPANVITVVWILNVVFYVILLILALRAIKALERIGISLAGIASGLHDKGRSQ